MTFAVPVYDEGNAVSGVFIADVDSKWLSTLLSDIVIGKSGSCLIADQNGVTLAGINQASASPTKCRNSAD